MKRIMITLIIGGFLGLATVFAADPKAEVINGAKKLADKPNYSWTSTSKAEGNSPNWRVGPVQGKFEKGGYTYFTGTFGDITYQAALKDSKTAFKGEDQWESGEELETHNTWVARRLQAFKPPAAEAEDLAMKTKKLKKGADGVYSGDLTAEGVKELLTRGRRSSTPPAGPKGWAKFWIKDGLLTKYEFNLQGTITVGQEQNEVEYNRTTMVEIKEVGTTTVNIPEEAKKKLS